MGNLSSSEIYNRSIIENAVYKSSNTEIVLTYQMTSIFTFFGLIGNFLYFLSTFKLTRKPHYYIYIYFVLSCDFLVTLNFIFWPFLFYIKEGNIHSNYFITYICQVQPVFVEFCASNVNWITVVVSVDRLIAIHKPYDYGSIFTMSRIIKACVGISLFNLLLNIPRYWAFQVYELYNDGKKVYRPIQNINQLTFCYDQFCCIVMYLIPVLVSTIVNVLLIFKNKVGIRVHPSYPSHPCTSIVSPTTLKKNWNLVRIKSYLVAIKRSSIFNRNTPTLGTHPGEAYNNNVNNNGKRERPINRSDLPNHVNNGLFSISSNSGNIHFVCSALHQNKFFRHLILNPFTDRPGKNSNNVATENISNALTMMPSQISSHIYSIKEIKNSLSLRNKYLLNNQAAMLILVQSSLLFFFNAPFVCFVLKYKYFWNNSFSSQIYEKQIIIHFIKHLNPLLGVYVNILFDKNVRAIFYGYIKRALSAVALMIKKKLSITI
ncbi:unnamed protein product [Gordionus sp. m RMFG-2023]